MVRAVLFSVALIVSSVLVIGAIASGSPPASFETRYTLQTGDVAMLLPGSPSEAQLAKGSVDVSASVAQARSDAGARLERYAFEARLTETNDQNTVINNGLQQIENRTAALRNAERQQWHAFVNGSVDRRQLLGDIAEATVEAQQLVAWLSEINSLTAPQSNRQDRVNRLRRDLAPFVGTARTELVRTFRGARTASLTYVSTAPSGITLSTVVDGEYVRETYRFDRQSFPAEQLTPLTRAGELFSEVAEWYNLPDQSPNLQSIGTHAYIFELQVTGGTIRSYVDGGTERVYYEVQTRELDRLTSQPSVTFVQNDTRMVVNRTVPGGPLRIATYHNSSGVLVSNTVEINGMKVESGSSGVTWVLAPHAGRLDITARTSTGDVVAQVWGIEPTALNETT